jgi:selenoprotein W-related protein
LTDEVLRGWAPVIAELELVPSSGGRFEVTLDGELLYSKAATGRHAHDGEIVTLVRKRIGPELLG